MIFAKVDVKLRDHLKAHRAGAAMATWTWALLYSREQETDGDIYPEVLRGSWVGEAAALEHAAKLVEVGLWDVIDGGWRIRNYSAKNETKEAIDEKRRSDRFRKRKSSPPPTHDLPSGIRTESERNPESVTGGSVVGIPGSYSGSSSGSGSRGELERGPASVVQQTADPQAAVPDWWAGVLATISTDTAVVLPERESWLRYAGHRVGKSERECRPYPPTRGDAIHWLTTVMVKEARESREKARQQRERDAKFDARRAGPASPTDATKLTDDEQKRFAEQLRQRMQRKGAA